MNEATREANLAMEKRGYLGRRSDQPAESKQRWFKDLR